LREITDALHASEGKLKHLGLPEAPARSTLAYANSHRRWQLFETVSAVAGGLPEAAGSGQRVATI